MICGSRLVGVIAAYVNVGEPGAIEHQEQLVPEVRPDRDLVFLLSDEAAVAPLLGVDLECERLVERVMDDL